jgi:hypothetical protein
VVNYWRHGHWFTQARETNIPLFTLRIASPRASLQMASVSSYDAKGTALHFGWGMNQGAEGDATGESWYIEVRVSKRLCATW